jgi:Ala-tRNA(Pro) deacylase
MYAFLRETVSDLRAETSGGPDRPHNPNNGDQKSAAQITLFLQIDYNSNVSGPAMRSKRAMGIRDYLNSRHVAFEVMLHRPAPCASRFAQSLHVPGDRVAKSVLLGAGEGYVLAVLPATHRIDFDRLTAALGVGDLRMADENEIEHVFYDCERGSVPPFGRLYGLTTIIDASLAGGAEIVFEGNMRHEGLRMRYRDYETLEGPVRARFASVAEPKRRKAPHRRAG